MSNADGLPPNDDQIEKEFLSYEGTKVPRFLAFLWLAFLIGSVTYLIRFVPESMMEWFSGE